MSNNVSVLQRIIYIYVRMCIVCCIYVADVACHLRPGTMNTIFLLPPRRVRDNGLQVVKGGLDLLRKFLLAGSVVSQMRHCALLNCRRVRRDKRISHINTQNFLGYYRMFFLYRVICKRFTVSFLAIDDKTSLQSLCGYYTYVCKSSCVTHFIKAFLLRARYDSHDYMDMIIIT